MKKVYVGKVTIGVLTVVDSCDDLTEERNNAHAACDSDFFAKFQALAEKEGFYVDFVGADLHHTDEVTQAEIDLIHEHKEKMKALKEKGKGTLNMRIQL